MNGNQLDVFGKREYDRNGRGSCARQNTKTRISGGASWIRRITIRSLLVATVACQPGPADVGSTPPEAAMTSDTTTTADSDANTADSAPISGLRPAAGSFRQRYLSDLAPVIVHCMNDLGWEATYDPRLGALLAEVPFSQQMERDGAMSFCLAGSHTYRGIYAD